MKVVNKALSDPSALIALFVALLALVVSFWQTREQRDHNRLSVKPMIDVSSDLSSSDGFCGLSIENQGPGPARIRSVWFEVDGVVIDPAVKNGWPLATKALEVDTRYVSYRSFYEGDVLASGERLPYFGIFPGKSTPERRRDLKDRLGSLVINICYCSIYEQCELYSTGFHTVPDRREVRSCKPPEAGSPG